MPLIALNGVMNFATSAIQMAQRIYIGHTELKQLQCLSTSKVA
uniref:Uncharacterized protein n=1 Tax=Siphoviridae sp. ctPJ52 TaxID=2825483 RepID=A0A8S5US30_9CAUD|nr:MAG TPA: hypothetical protein [Siphoviridae sp. ctPJ52]DAZ16274.1 MAG TPA: hypothetical protein [Caudoviricetes sp.]